MKDLSEIFIVGHSGLQVVGFDESKENWYYMPGRSD